MEERSDSEKLDEVMLPGFRFHPTDEELVGFYLKRKIQQRPLSIELIKQLDIYKYDPWDLPKLASTGEKEWYFYCPRDRKYRNSARPNRVTGAGFWKATGTDRPIYSSEGSKCIGLKKSLVFYKGRAAKGIKTDWMMHEFRLPSLIDSSSSPKKYIEKTIPANDSWAICRIFKKTNSTAQRALSHSWVSPLPHEIMTTSHDQMLSKDEDSNTQFCSSMDHHNIPLTKKTSLANHFSNNHNNDHLTTTTTTTSTTLCPLDVHASYKPIINPLLLYRPFDQLPIISNNGDLMFSSSVPPPLEPSSGVTNNNKPTTMDVSSMLLSMSSSVLGDFGAKAAASSSEGAANFGGFVHQDDQHYSSNNNNHHHGYSIVLPLIQEGNHHEMVKMNNHASGNVQDQIENTVRSNNNNNNSMNGFALGSMPNNLNIGDAWKSNLLWDSSSCPCDHHVHSTYSTTKCYT